jgi:hypothetical protein
VGCYLRLPAGAPSHEDAKRRNEEKRALVFGLLRF